MKHLRRYQVYASDKDGELLEFLGFAEDWDLTAEDAVRSMNWFDSETTLRRVRARVAGRPNLFLVQFPELSVPAYYRASLVR